jgi:uncharacterized protein YndB with AHSA1/START domain
MSLIENFSKFQLEFPVKCSQKLLFNFLSTPSGLSEWFCDDVNIQGKNCEFFWNGSSQKAQIISLKPNKSIKFKWEHMPKDSFFELSIDTHDLSQSVSLIITDFAEKEELEESKLLWETQVAKLMHCLGM